MTSSTKRNRRQFLRDLSVTAGAAAVATSSSASASGNYPVGAPLHSLTASRQETREVSFMSIGSLQEQQIYQEAIEAAQNESLDDSNVKINWVQSPADDWAKVMTMFAAGEAYDIQRIDDDRIYLLALENKIHQLDPWMLDPNIGLNLDQYYDRFFTSVAVEGYQFAMLPAGSANVVYYNVDLFEEAGITAPTSWSEAWEFDVFLENARKLSKVSGNRTDVYGIGFPANIVTPIGYGAGASALTEDQTSCAFDTDDVHNALDPIVKLITEELVAVPPEIEPLEMFNGGMLAMMWGAMNLVAEISEGINWGIMPWAKTPQFAMTENYDRAFVIPKSAKDPEAAYIGLKALTEKAAADVYARYRWAVPNLIASAEGEVFNDPSRPPENTNVWIETFGEVNGHQVDVPTPRGPIGEVWKESFTGADLPGALFSGQISTREYLDSACARVNDEIARQNWSATEGLDRLLASDALADPDTKVLG